MAKNVALNNGTSQTKRAASELSPQFFPPQKNQKIAESPPENPEKTPTLEKQQPVQEIKVQTTVEYLLAAILQTLETRNKIELMKLQIQAEQEKMESELAQKMEEADNARFEEIKPSMYI
ncbi:hypothetical protein [Legionella sp. W05-934-2]|uniref:hypothetical protein n=1 Tax=Legionella sp. W05-934-2 TaxID=1198649 RepID=UPI003461D96C